MRIDKSINELQIMSKTAVGNDWFKDLLNTLPKILYNNYTTTTTQN